MCLYSNLILKKHYLQGFFQMPELTAFTVRRAMISTQRLVGLVFVFPLGKLTGKGSFAIWLNSAI